jgi:hypothetical protein
MLRNTEFRCVQNLPRELRPIANAPELFNQLFEKEPVFANGKTLNVLENKMRGFQFGNDADELANEAIPGVVQSPVADHGESLARCAPKHDIDPASANPRGLPDLFARQTDDRPGQDGAARKII